MKNFSFIERDQVWKNCEDLTYDLIIIGGGINGAGVARDAASRGLKVLTIEAQDFASGTSSRSSKLIHGGIRYLENLEFKLVFEALSERAHLFEMAPHMVHPLRFFIPIYKQSRVGMLAMGLGMWLYDALSLFKAPKLHQRLSAKKALDKFSTLKPEQLVGGYEYSDAYMDDDRLVFETLRSANEYGAQALSYVRAENVIENSNGMIKLQIADQLTPAKKIVKARHIVSSVGPWTDDLGKMIDLDWKKILRPTKGVHLTFNRADFELANAVVMGAETRIVFAIPRHEMVIVGTTDTDFSGDPGKVKVERDDIVYLLKVINDYFPGARISENHIVGAYAGVRPLVSDGASTEGKTSREHTIFTHQNQFTFVAGGKYTTYRLMAEQVVDQTLKFLPKALVENLAKSQSKLPLNSLITKESFAKNNEVKSALKARSSWKSEEVDWFVDRHGAEAAVIFDRNHKLNPTYWQLEAIHAIESTMCLNLIDFFSRRVPLFLAEKDHGHSKIQEVSQVFAAKLNWSPAHQQLEIEKLLAEHAQLLMWRIK